MASQNRHLCAVFLRHFNIDILQENNKMKWVVAFIYRLRLTELPASEPAAVEEVDCV